MEENESLVGNRLVLSYGSSAVKFFPSSKGSALSLIGLLGEELATISLGCSV
jgi:hypothetical protein